MERLDSLRFVTYMASTIKPWENVLAQVELGTLDAKMMEGGRREMLRHFSQPGMQQWWVRGREAFSSELVAFVDNEILPVVASMENQRSDR